jgi:serine/threonine protein kinase/tetratricopeptide (TPR) repeat protein
MVCPRCGKTIANPARGCRSCGGGVAAGTLTPPPASSASRREIDAPTIAGGLDAPTVVAGPDDAATSFGSAAATTYSPPQAAPTLRDGGDATRFPGMDSPTGTGDSLTDAGFGGNEGSEHGPLNIGQVFGTRYHIIRLLGVGGMGAVYQAWDQELSVGVAIKVIRPEVMADPTAAADIERRFKRELLLARQVTHKNVVRIHDLGEIDGIKYITMAYVNGADLATLIRKQGRVPVSKTLRIARSVVSGLVAAHGAGVVHRDLKPANIMVDGEDEALIMDFGIARSTGAPVAGPLPGANTIVRNLNRAAAAANRDATVLGAIIGTVEYMAPEQAKGEHVDQRADVYAFGLILYDMLVGGPRAEHAGSAFAELQGRMRQAPPPVKSLVPAVPEHVDRIVSRCLEPDPEKRFQASVEVAAELNRLDAEGVPIPEPRRLTPAMIAAGVALVAALLAGTWWSSRQSAPPKPHDPVTVLIADFTNDTGDATFDHTLEPMLRLALEGAGFVTAYDRTRVRPALGLTPPDKFDEVSAREVAVKQGLGVVLSGLIQNRGGGYEISVKASQTATGNAIASARGRASSKTQVLGTATDLAARVRRALGDQTVASAQLLGMKGLSTSSLDAVSQYAAAVDAQARGKYEDARRSFLKAIEIDPKFGLAYQGLAAASKSLGMLQDSEKYAGEALRYLDSMTERERFATRGNYYRMTGDFQQCVKEYRELIARYAADTVALNNLGVCRAKMRDMPGAVDAMRQAVQILPNRVNYRANLALFADYAGDFTTAEREVRGMPNPDAHGVAALALSQMGQGRLEDAAETFRKLAAMDAWGASFAPAGLADVALYEGRFSDAARILEEGATADLQRKNGDNAAMKYAALSYVHLVWRHNAQAIAAADRALEHSKAVAIRFLTARVYVEAGAAAKAAESARGLSAELAAEPQADGKIIEGEIALKQGDARQAIKVLSDATQVLDTWLGHFDLGRAYLALNAFPQADSEFDRCIKRRGEALSLLDEDPTYGYLPTAYYFLGRAREGLKTAGFAESYREYIKIRGQSREDPLLPEVRLRAGG